MRRSIKRAGYLMATVLLALVGVVTLTGTASAARENTTMASAARVQSCPFPAGSGCVTDSAIIQANTQAVTFCFSDIFHVIYSVQRERGGFVNRTTLVNPNDEGCFGAGGFGSVHTNSDLNSCASGCRNFGGVTAGSQVGVFCQHDGAYLVYVDNSALAGFLPANRVSVQGNPAQC
jgi:hypothetical protein